jgi:hypothetical protein
VDLKTYRYYHSCGLPGSWAIRLAKSPELLKAFRQAHPLGAPIQWGQVNGYRVADWVIAFFREGDRRS